MLLAVELQTNNERFQNQFKRAVSLTQLSAEIFLMKSFSRKFQFHLPVN